MSQADLRTVLSIEKFHRDDAVVVFPLFVLFQSPGEHDLLAGRYLAVYAGDGHFFTFRVREVPTKLPPYPHIGDHITSLNIFRTEPLL